MSLYTSVYWTKRTVIVISLILFICSGIRIFQFVSKRFTKVNPSISDYKPELGFGVIDKLMLTAIDTPPTFKPLEFKNSTLKGNLDVDNGYPLETTRVPLANVYKIREVPIDLNTTETPRRIAKNFGFTKEPTQSTSTTQTWAEGSKELEINGQYLLIKYKDNTIRRQTQSTGELLQIGQSDTLKSTFSDILRAYGVITDLEGYKFRADYVVFNRSTGTFDFAESEAAAQFIRINAERQYPTVLKHIENSTTNATYPGRLHSNNYIVLPSKLPRGASPREHIAELSLYNWPLSGKDEADNNVQTYTIKTPRQALQELQNSNKYLASATEISLDGNQRKRIELEELSEITRVDIFRIRLEMFEDVINTTYIQPVYTFICQAEKDGKLIELVYYIPALTDTVTK